MVGSSHRLSEVEPTTPSAPASEASRHLINGAATPPWAKEGTASPQTVGPASSAQPSWLIRTNPTKTAVEDTKCVELGQTELGMDGMSVHFSV